MRTVQNTWVAAILGCGGMLFATLPAGAMPWGHDDWGTNRQATNCGCAAADQPAALGRQLQAAASKPTTPGGTVRNNTAEIGKVQR